MEYLYRALEGLSTGAMSLCFFSATHASPPPFLMACYLVHWMGSFFYHWYRTPATYSTDVTLISILIDEKTATYAPVLAPLVYGVAIASNVSLNRVYPLYHHYPLYPLYPLYPRHHREVIIKSILGVVLCVSLYPEVVLGGLCVLLGGFFFFVSDGALRSGQRGVSAVTCIAYHICLGISSFYEGSIVFPLLPPLFYFV
jgi:hypothetical protein